MEDFSFKKVISCADYNVEICDYYGLSSDYDYLEIIINHKDFPILSFSIETN